MGIKLVEEVMDWCPEDLTPTQRWCLTVLARDAHDVTRETFHGPEHPEILRRVRMAAKKWEAMRSFLMKRGLLEPVSGGYRGKTVRYRIASMFAPCVIQDWRKTPLERGAFGGYAVKGDRKDPLNEGGLSEGKTPRNQGVNVQKDPPNKGGPTPPSFSSQPPSSPAPAPEVPSTVEEQPAGREGGGIAALNKPTPPGYLALAKLTAKDPRLTVGQTELEALAPLAETWLERVPADRLEAALTTGLPTAIANPAGFLRGRLIKKLPPPRIPDETQERCGQPNCDPVTHMVTLPDQTIDFCPICHPTGRARARRTRGVAA